jgi:hypothetical protein
MDGFVGSSVIVLAATNRDVDGRQRSRHGDPTGGLGPVGPRPRRPGRRGTPAGRRFHPGSINSSVLRSVAEEPLAEETITIDDMRRLQKAVAAEA